MNLLKTQIPIEVCLCGIATFTFGSCDNNRGICVFGALTSVDALFYFFRRKSMKKSAIVLFFLLFVFISGCKETDVIKPNPTPSPTESYSENIVVYVTETGKCYHLNNCMCLRYSKYEKELLEIVDEYRPCQICCPPEVGE